MKPYTARNGHVQLLSPVEVRNHPLWKCGFADFAKDTRYYEIVDETLGADFQFYYLLVEGVEGDPGWIQPVFVVRQDLVATAPPWLRSLAGTVRKLFPNFLRLPMLMAGCAAGEAHPFSHGGRFSETPTSCSRWSESLQTACAALPAIARSRGIPLVIWKDWPAQYRPAFEPVLRSKQFARVDSMPATTLELTFRDFQDYMARHLSHAMRKNMRRKFRATEGKALAMTVHTDISDVVGEIHALYEQVYSRSALQFEHLTLEFLLALSQRMQDRARFFLWRLDGRLIACSICLIHDGVLYDEYLGLDYSVALDFHLYFVTIRDILSWAMQQGIKTYRSTPLDYDPKLHLGFRLAPLDLYVAGSSPVVHALVHRFLPLIEPTRAEPCLRHFPPA